MILDYLTPERILLAGRARDKHGVLGELTQLLAEGGGVPAADILAQLVEREAVMSTGIGHGVAVPHARLGSCAAMRLALVRYPRGIEFGALDGLPVHLAFGIVGPPQGTGLHVKLLARIARLVKEGSAVRELMAASDVPGAVSILAARDA